MKTKIMNAKAEDIGERTIRFCISSEVVDRDGDTLVAKGCDFKNYAKNPVFCSFHNTRDFPLGKCVKYWAEEKKVYADVYFPTIEELSSDPENASEKAKLVDFTYHCYKTGMLNAVSVGFIIKDYIQDKTTGGLIVNTWELLEFSAVCVPANQDAIAQARKSLGSEEASEIITTKKSYGELERELEELTNEIKELRELAEKQNDEIELELENEKDTIDIDSIEYNEDFDLTEL